MQRKWVWLAILIGVLAVTGYAADRGDPIFHTDTDELDIPSLKVGGVPVSTEAGTSGSYAPALLATTENITLSGEQTIDGVLTSADAIVVWMQTNAAQNGIYVSGGGAWARRTDMDIAGEFAGHQSVYVQAGTRFAGTTFRVANVTAVTVGTTAIVLAPDAPQWHVKALQTIAASGSIDCTPPQGQVIGAIVPIVGDGEPVTLGSPQIIAGTRINQFCHIVGTDGANTVEMGDGSGVQLAQSDLPLLFDDRLTALLRWDGMVWRQVDQAGVATGSGIGTLQQAYQTGDVGGFTSLPESRPYVKAPAGELGPRVLIHDGGGSGDYIEERLVGVNTPGSLPNTLIQPDDSFTISALLGDPLSEITIGRIRNIGGLSMVTEGVFNATQDHIDTNIAAHNAWAISFTPAGYTETSVQQALDKTTLWTLPFTAAGLIVDSVACVTQAKAQINSGPTVIAVVCADSASGTLEWNFVSPSRWDGGDLTVTFMVADTTSSSMVWSANVRAMCRTPGTDTINATWGTALPATATMVTANIPYAATAVITPNTGCLGGDLVFIHAVINAATTHTDSSARVISGVVTGR